MISLKPVLDFFESRGGANAWTQGAIAVDANNEVVGYDDPNACRWCLLGATLTFGGGIDDEFRDEICRRIKSGQALDVDYSIGSWNDDPGQTWKSIRKILIDK